MKQPAHKIQKSMPASTKRPRSPRYREYDRWNTDATAYMRAYLSLTKDAPQHAEIKQYLDFCAMRLVFESNLIERAGLSEGETRRVVQEYFPKVPSNYEAFRALSRAAGGKHWGKIINKGSLGLD